ncbi:hypothetical protein [Paucibacter sp. DJ2R-2]|uniref:T4 family baseplate hub assembly chaperone n=1 Tax=Paucibacter sp. DJ2R-2 TaxID=2893558 RepID=UPI0021E4F878|nr:hypothetical protein [Paucibacter sp. DJ2R-2]MCV2420219.1 hypothetical protein [Paucibacter sp. DJ4R-1]MCV2436836.1 hypothetical protein [Paucibacter sp. DJ2R-2]
MSTLSSADWLDLLDSSRSLPPPLRACALLDGVWQAEPGWAASLPLGQRDRQLLELQQALFGPQLELLAECPRCGERLELALQVPDLMMPIQPQTSAEELTLELDGRTLRCRLPDSRDLWAAAQLAEEGQARALLMSRCLQAVDSRAEARAGDDALVALSDSALQTLSAALSAADPQAHTELALQCPACQHDWSEGFDIASYLLGALASWSERCLDQVHLLARAYGWSEAQVLALSPSRRARYLERVLA